MLLTSFNVLLLVNTYKRVGVNLFDNFRKLTLKLINYVNILIEALLVVNLHNLLYTAVVEPNHILVNILGESQYLSTGAFGLNNQIKANDIMKQLRLLFFRITQVVLDVVEKQFIAFRCISHLIQIELLSSRILLR